MYDVIVVGAGPTGSVTSLLCKRYGLNTLLLEKKKMPRRKPCGGAVSQKALELLKSLDIHLPPKLIQKKVFGVRVHKPDKTDFLMESRSPLAVLVLRKDFDFFLVKKAIEEGVDFIEKAEVTDVINEKNKVKVITKNGESYRAKIIVGADGAIGRVAKSTGIRKRWDKERCGLCLEAEPHVSEKIIKEQFGEKTYIEAYFGVVDGGYAWVFPKRNCISIGAGGPRNKLKKLGQTFKKFYERFPFLEIEKKEVAGHLIPAGGVKRQLVANNVLLAGDAAGFVDAFAGEGIYYGMKSGTLAAQIISEAEKYNDFSMTKLLDYQNRCWKSFGSDLKVALKFALRLHSNSNFYLSILENDKKSQKCYLQIAKGKKTYRQFSRKLYSRALLSLIKMLVHKS